MRRLVSLSVCISLASVGALFMPAVTHPEPARASIPGCLAGDVVDIASTPSGNGYWAVGSDGGVFSFGDARFFGSMGGRSLNKPVVSVVVSATGSGYWLIAADGGVFAFGDAAPPARNPLPAMDARGELRRPIVEATRLGRSGLALVAGDGGVFALGGAPFYGSMGGQALNEPMVDIVPTATGAGYFTVAADGGIFAFGDARPLAVNPLPGMRLQQPVVAAARAGGNGLWLVAADGGVFSLNGAPFLGSMGGKALAKPVSGITSNRAGTRYWLSALDGGVFAFPLKGGAYFGNAVGSANCGQPKPLPAPSGKIMAIATDILNRKPVNPWRGGAVPYAWGGGHGSIAGPSKGTCAGYTGSVRPCPATVTVGVDCSGFVRWVYRQAYGVDIFGGVNTNGQIAKLKRVSSPQPGDLVFFGKSASNTHHVGIYAGNNRMINALKTGTVIRVDALLRDVVGYYRVA